MITKQARAEAVALSESGALLTLADLCLVLNVGRDYGKQMVRAGFVTFGGRTTVQDALQWLRGHPNFKERQRRNSAKLSRNSAIKRRNSDSSEKRSKSRANIAVKANGVHKRYDKE